MFISVDSPKQISLLVVVSLVQSSPLKVSKPQAVTVANLTDSQVKQLIAENPPQNPPVTYPDSDRLSAPLIPLYLPDPERNKYRDDYYAEIDSHDDSPIKSHLSLDPYALPLNIPADRFSSNVEAAERDKTIFSYQDRFDHYQPRPAVLDKHHAYDAEELYLMEMQPPLEDDAPNYFAVKPKKIPKKYQPNKKDVNISKSKFNPDKLVPIDNDGLVLRHVAQDRTLYVTAAPVERFAPAPSLRRDLTEDDLNTGEYFPNIEARTEAITLDSTVPTLMIDTATAASAKLEKRNRAINDAGELNAKALSVGDRLRNDDRVEFQMHGFNGPNSYKFGFDTGLG